jgi:hypothetical protein
MVWVLSVFVNTVYLWMIKEILEGFELVRGGIVIRRLNSNRPFRVRTSEFDPTYPNPHLINDSVRSTADPCLKYWTFCIRNEWTK